MVRCKQNLSSNPLIRKGFLNRGLLACWQTDPKIDCISPVVYLQDFSSTDFITFWNKMICSFPIWEQTLALCALLSLVFVFFFQVFISPYLFDSFAGYRILHWKLFSLQILRPLLLYGWEKWDIIYFWKILGSTLCPSICLWCALMDSEGILNFSSRKFYWNILDNFILHFFGNLLFWNSQYLDFEHKINPLPFLAFSIFKIFLLLDSLFQISSTFSTKSAKEFKSSFY